MSSHLCCGVKDNCYARLWSYGEICVRCGCCSKDVAERRKARLGYWGWWLGESLLFDQWADDAQIKAIQERNNKDNIRHARRMVRYYERFARQ